jgi:hypothetical protein
MADSWLIPDQNGRPAPSFSDVKTALHKLCCPFNAISTPPISESASALENVPLNQLLGKMQYKQQLLKRVASRQFQRLWSSHPLSEMSNVIGSAHVPAIVAHQRNTLPVQYNQGASCGFLVGCLLHEAMKHTLQLLWKPLCSWPSQNPAAVAHSR